MYDGFLRKIDYLRLSVTARCNLYCRYCRTKEACQFSGYELGRDQIFNIISAFYNLGIKKLRLTGGEPFLREDIFEIIDFAHEVGIEDINVTTNGVLEDKTINRIINSKLNSINISLDTLDRKRYSELTSVDALDRVLNTIKSLSKFKKVKVNTVLMRTINFDEVEELIKFSKQNNVIIRFIELMPVGVANRIFEKEFVSIDEVLKKFNNFKKINLNTKSVAKYYHVLDFDYVVGFISSVSTCFCDDCNKVRVSSEGILYNCLFDNRGLDLKNYLHSQDVLIEKIKGFVLNKGFVRKLKTDSMMFKIGG